MNKVYGKHNLGIELGVMALVLLLAGGVGAATTTVNASDRVDLGEKGLT